MVRILIKRESEIFGTDGLWRAHMAGQGESGARAFRRGAGDAGRWVGCGEGVAYRMTQAVCGAGLWGCRLLG